MNYGQLAFTDAIKKMQEEAGSRSAYDRMEKMSVTEIYPDTILLVFKQSFIRLFLNLFNTR
jgi:hypothetical protein